MRLQSWVSVLITAPLVACAGAPVRLELPADNSPAERQQAYDAMKSVRYLYSFSSIGKHSSVGIATVSGVVLGDGRKVRSVDDLLPVVAQDSSTAFHARRSSSWKVGGLWAGLVFGVGTAAALSILTSDALLNSEEGSGHGLFTVGVVTAAIALLAGAAPLVLFEHLANVYEERAFRSYNRDLSNRLELD